MTASGQKTPKSIVPIGTKPLIWHLMRQFSKHNINENLLALGHHQTEIRAALESISQPTSGSSQLIFKEGKFKWQARLFDTGLETNTAGRIKRLSDHLQKTFILAWSDGLMNVEMPKMQQFHQQHAKLATILAVRPPSRFGRLQISSDACVATFSEKQALKTEWINGGLFILEPDVIAYIKDDASSWEYDVLPALAKDGELMAWQHESFWQCADYAHEIDILNNRWHAGKAPWV